MIRMKAPRGGRVLAVLVVLLVAGGTWVWVRSAAGVQLAPTAVLRVDTSRPGNEFALGAVGLSMEARELSTGRLTADHYRLVRLMRLLGPSVLRIGGNSVDFSWWTSSSEPPPPWATNIVTPADLSVLHGLLTATGWRVLLGVDLGHFEPARAAEEARYAREILGPDLLGIEIGNEPNDYGHKLINLRPLTYSLGEYLRETEAYRQALIAATPGVAVYGPALTEENSWLVQMGATARMFTELTQHDYPIKTCSATTSPSGLRPTAAELLTPTVREQEDQILNTLAKAGAIAGRPTRIGETNSVACPGNAAASPAFAGAMWALDWALRAASSGVTGLNFHGDPGICSADRESPICAPSYYDAQAGEVAAQPEYYGLLAARQLKGGRFVPTRLIAPGPLPDLTTWATLAPDGTVGIAIDNMATTGLPQPVSISMSGYTVTEEKLIGPSVEASSAISLGGAAVTGGGKWWPRPTKPFHTRRSVRVIVRPASAVIVTLQPKRSPG